jgi:hypothetical protein
VEVSLANPDVVWAASTLTSDNIEVLVSIDGGDTFDPVQNYEIREMGNTSGLSTHPTQEGTAYLTFSFARSPKILKTTDFGSTWEDISGYEGGSESTSGFPDVAVYCVFVFPYDTNKIWAGTEIGLVETLDGGLTWNLANNGLPSVSVWDIKAVDDEIVLATHGRGIWSVVDSDLMGDDTGGTDDEDDTDDDEVVTSLNELKEKGIFIYPNPVTDYMNIDISSEMDIAMIRIISVSGRIIHEFGRQEIRNNSLRWNKGPARPGIYFVRIEDSDGKGSTSKILVR